MMSKAKPHFCASCSRSHLLYDFLYPSAGVSAGDTAPSSGTSEASYGTFWHVLLTPGSTSVQLFPHPEMTTNMVLTNTSG